jgi:hypothetical protein
MRSLLLLTLLAAQGTQPIVTRGDAPPVAPDPLDAALAHPDPDAVTRGQATTIVVVGRDPEALKTVGIAPADGIRLGAITPLAPRPDGLHAISVAVTVDAHAAAGDRELTIMDAPRFSTTTAPGRAGGDDMQQRMQEMMQAIAARETRPLAVATIHINAHDVTIANVDARREGDRLRLRVTAVDERADITAEGAGPTGIIAIDQPKPSAAPDLVTVVEALETETRCGSGLVDTFADDIRIEGRQGSTVVLTASLDAAPVAGRTDCEVRVRVRDRDGNASRWTSAMLGRQSPR